MPRIYKPKKECRSYQGYSDEKLCAALLAIKNGMSLRSAGKKFGIPHTTLANKVKEKHCKKMGGQTVFTPEEEKIFADAIIQLAVWYYPLTKQDIREILKNYLDKMGKTIDKFKDNTPGRDFVEGFIKRNQLTTIVSSRSANISRAKVSVFWKIISSTEPSEKQQKGLKIIPAQAIEQEQEEEEENLILKKEEQNDDLCRICKCAYEGNKCPDWLKCTYCSQWVCGFCNERSKEKNYICQICLDEE